MKGGVKLKEDIYNKEVLEKLNYLKETFDNSELKEDNERESKSNMKKEVNSTLER